MRLPPIIFVITLCVIPLAMTGCALFGPSVEKAQEIAERRQLEMDKAVSDLRAAETELKDLLAQYDAAVKADDKTTAEKLVLLINAAMGKKEAAEKVAESSSKLFEGAVQDFKDAKSASDYIGTVLGWLGMAFTTVIGGTGATALAVKNARSQRALSITSASAEKALPDDNPAGKSFRTYQLDAFKNDGGALKALKKARGK
jgi:hypothetical protein